MEVSQLRHYGKAFSDAESAWPEELKARMQRDGMAAVMRGLSIREKLCFFAVFALEKRRADMLDLSDLAARGMTNERFLSTQRTYLAMYAALTRVVGPERALTIGHALMDASSREAMLYCLPTPEQVAALDDPGEGMRQYLDASVAACQVAGCNKATVVREGDRTYGMDITWCVWLELAQRMGVPEACLPNCYADDIAFPEYFAAQGVSYKRTTTLAKGGRCCDFRFTRDA